VTTSVFYDASQRGLDMARQRGSGTTAGVTITNIYANLTALLTTGVTNVQSVNNSSNTTNPTATFSTTPTNGNAMIAIVIRGADNVSSTNGSWTQLTAQGSAGNRRVEMWWRRAGASEATTHTWTNATAALWEVTLIEFGGWAAVADPVTIAAGTNVSSTNTRTFEDIGLLCGVQAVATSGGSAGTFTDNSTAVESTTNLAVTTTTRFYQSIAQAWTNNEDQTIKFDWTTNRPFTCAQVGWRTGDSTYYAAQTYVGNGASSSDTQAGQHGFSFNTAAIPDTDTVTSATLTLQSSSSPLYPANTAVNIYSLAGASIQASNANGPAIWKTPTELGSLTRVATRAAGSAWAGSTGYAWTSDATFPAQINKTGDTTLLVATGDQQSGTTRATAELLTLEPTAGSVHYLTVIHNYQAASTVAATTSVTPAVSTATGFARTVAATLLVTPAIAVASAFSRTVAAITDMIAAVSYTASVAPINPQAVKHLTLYVKNRIALPVASKVSLTVRSILRLPEH